MSSSRTSLPHAPRAVDPDLPTQLVAASALHPRSDVSGIHLAGTQVPLSLAHGTLTESRLEALAAESVDLTGSRLRDVRLDGLRVASLVARDAAWTSVCMEGGRIGTLDGLRASWDGVIIRGVRIDFLSLPSATLTDVHFSSCTFGTIDLPEASLTRVRFEDCRADEVDTRGLRGDSLDLRGLEALDYTDPRGLRDAFLTARQTETHAARLASALGIRIVG